MDLKGRRNHQARKGQNRENAHTNPSGHLHHDCLGAQRSCRHGSEVIDLDCSGCCSTPHPRGIGVAGIGLLVVLAILPGRIAERPQHLQAKLCEVETSLSNEGLLADREQYLQASVRDNSEAYRLEWIQFEIGITHLLSVLQFQGRLLSARGIDRRRARAPDEPD